MVSSMRSLVIAGLLLCGCHKDTQQSCIPVLLTVKNEGVKIAVKHQTGGPIDFGTGPLTRATGVCLGDTVQLTDGQRFYEESIQFGEPHEERVIALK
jgi:hypothetical protein